jgi:hypothetical protein
VDGLDVLPESSAMIKQRNFCPRMKSRRIVLLFVLIIAIVTACFAWLLTSNYKTKWPVVHPEKFDQGEDWQRDTIEKLRNLLRTIIRKMNAEQAGTGQPATSPESKSEGSHKPQPEAEGRSR